MAKQSTGTLSWDSALMALLISHLAGDFLAQTDWQASNKNSGYASPLARKALLRHLATYTLAFTPALAWFRRERGGLRAVKVGTLVAIPHVVIDEGSLVRRWLRAVKHVDNPEPRLTIMVDQTFHVLSLLCAAMVAAK